LIDEASAAFLAEPSQRETFFENWGDFGSCFVATEAVHEE